MPRPPSILILGFGREGGSLLPFLRARHPEARFGVADRRTEIELPPGFEDVELCLGPEYLRALERFDVVYRSPGIALPDDVRNAARFAGQCTSLMNLFFELVPGKVIGVTGTKGKSTTASLIHHLLAAAIPDVRLAGNIGRPALDVLAGATEETLFVVELSSFQLEDLRFSPHVAVVLGVVPEHLDHHGDLREYVSAKQNIVRFQSADDFTIFSEETPRSAELCKISLGTKLAFSTEDHPSARAFVSGGEIVLRSSDGARIPIAPLSELPLPGRGNLLNALAALAAVSVFTADATLLGQAVRSFRPLEHRLEPVGSFAGIEFINDSLSTIPEAAVNAIDAFGERARTIILGGYDRGLTFDILADALARSSIETMILFPTTGAKIHRSLQERHPERARAIRAVNVDSMEAAVRSSFELTPSGGVCLLSPASSSFSMFRDYKERGEMFRKTLLDVARERGCPISG